MLSSFCLWVWRPSEKPFVDDGKHQYLTTNVSIPIIDWQSLEAYVKIYTFCTRVQVIRAKGVETIDRGSWKWQKVAFSFSFCLSYKLAPWRQPPSKYIKKCWMKTAMTRMMNYWPSRFFLFLTKRERRSPRIYLKRAWWVWLRWPKKQPQNLHRRDLWRTKRLIEEVR